MIKLRTTPISSPEPLGPIVSHSPLLPQFPLQFLCYPQCFISVAFLQCYVSYEDWQLKPQISVMPFGYVHDYFLCPLIYYAVSNVSNHLVSLYFT